MDMVRRPYRPPGLSSQLVVEYPLPLAVCRIDAQHQGRGSRCHPASTAVFLSADASCSSLDRSRLAHWPAGVVIHGAPETLSLSRLELSGRVHSLFCLTRE